MPEVYRVVDVAVTKAFRFGARLTAVVNDDLTKVYSRSISAIEIYGTVPERTQLYSLTREEWDKFVDAVRAVDVRLSELAMPSQGSGEA